MHKRLAIILSLFLVLVQFQIQAQNFSSYTVTKDTAFIGDPVYVNLKIVKSSPISKIDLSPLSTIKAINDSTQTDISVESYGTWKVDNNRLVDMNSISWITNADGKQESTTTLKLVFWDNGVYNLPQLRLANSMPLQSPLIVILAPQDVKKVAGDSTMAIMPIKPIIRELKNLKDYLPYILMLLGILGVIAMFNYFKNRKTNKVVEEIVIPERPSHEIALEELEELNNKKLWQNGKIKEYQSELTHVIRKYLGKRYGINALEHTTDEVINLLKETDFKDSLKSKVSNILQIADMIKFAKAKPSEDIHQTFWNEAKALVLETKLDEIKDDTTTN